MSKLLVAPCKLSQCHEGDSLVISKITGTGIFRKRMLEIGFTTGMVVRIVKYAPMKDPVELKVRNSHISIRIDEAELVYVVLYKIDCVNEISLSEGVHV